MSLKAENARLRNKNKELNLENFTHQNEILKWKKKFASLQTMHIQHCTMLTGELQSYAEKLSGVKCFRYCYTLCCFTNTSVPPNVA